MSIASSRLPARTTQSTGPKISSRTASDVGAHLVEDGGAEEAAAGLGAGVAAVHRELGAVLHGLVDRARIRSRAVSEITGPSSVCSSIPSPTRSAAVASSSGRHQAIVRLADGDHHRARHAALPGRPERRPDDSRHGLVDHRVGHHDHVVLGAAQRLHALARLGGPLVDDPRHRRRAHERDGVDARVVEDALHHLAAAVDQVHHARRQLELVEDLEGQLLGERHLLGRLQDEAVAAADRERQGTRTAPSPGS